MVNHAAQKIKQDPLEGLKREVAVLEGCGPRALKSCPPLRNTHDLEALLRSGFHECMGESAGDHAAALAFALSGAGFRQEMMGGPLLFCVLRWAQQETGLLHAPGLRVHGLHPDGLLWVNVEGETELYWAAEECLSASGLAAIVLDGGSGERHYDFTISRRLKLRVERSAVPLFLVRNWRGQGPSAAAARWRVSRLPSAPDPLDVPRQPLIGQPRFRLRLERGPAFPNQSWEFEYDASGGFHLATPLADRPSGSRPQRAAASAA